MYADDNRDEALGWQSIPKPWAAGAWDDPAVGTDPRILTDSPMWPYAKSLKVFFCAADGSKLTVGRDKLLPRVISYSQNVFISSGPPYWALATYVPTRKPVHKLSDLTAPGPSQIWVFIDEHENSINDTLYIGFLDLVNHNNQPWVDAPSGRHGNAAGVVFIDGHSEIHKWKTPGLSKRVLRSDGSMPRQTPVIPGPGAVQDWAWTTNHAAPLK
jgi:prepilin-type processing-associated H-X9-DG protein